MLEREREAPLSLIEDRQVLFKQQTKEIDLKERMKERSMAWRTHDLQQVPQKTIQSNHEQKVKKRVTFKCDMTDDMEEVNSWIEKKQPLEKMEENNSKELKQLMEENVKLTMQVDKCEKVISELKKQLLQHKLKPISVPVSVQTVAATENDLQEYEMQEYETCIKNLKQELNDRNKEWEEKLNKHREETAQEMENQRLIFDKERANVEEIMAQRVETIQELKKRLRLHKEKQKEWRLRENSLLDKQDALLRSLEKHRPEMISVGTQSKVRTKNKVLQVCLPGPQEETDCQINCADNELKPRRRRNRGYHVGAPMEDTSQIEGQTEKPKIRKKKSKPKDRGHGEFMDIKEEGFESDNNSRNNKRDGRKLWRRLFNFFKLKLK